MPYLDNEVPAGGDLIELTNGLVLSRIYLFMRRRGCPESFHSVYKQQFDIMVMPVWAALYSSLLTLVRQLDLSSSILCQISVCTLQ